MLGLGLTKYESKSFSIIHFLNIDEEILSKILEKTLLTISQGAIGYKNDKSSSAVIPVSELGLISFVYLVKDINQFIGINFIIQSNIQLRLYKCIPLLEKNAKNFLKELEKSNSATESFTLQSELVKSSFSELQKSSSLLLESDFQHNAHSDKSIASLIKLFGSNISTLYRTLLLNDKTVIFCEKALRIDDYPWKSFVPNRDLNIVAWPDNPRSIQEFDIMLVEPFRKKECDADCVIIDLSSHKFENGKQDKYLENFFDNLLELKTDLSFEINLEINNIFNWVNEIIEISTKEKDDKKIKQLVEFHSKTKFGNRLPLVTAIARKYNEFTAERISTFFLKELGIFEKDIIRIDTKKLLSKL